MTELDTMLRESLNRLAVPADPAGVAEAIQRRVDAGDAGTPTPKGGGGAALGALPWLAMIVVVGLIGGLLGALGVFGRPAAQVSLSGLALSNHLVAGLDCPGGAAAASFQPGERVLAVSRSADDAYLGVRDPSNRARTVWVATSSIVRDPHQNAVDSLPVSGCPVPTVSLPTTAHTTAPTKPTTKPTKPPTKPKPGDTTKPQIDAKAPQPGTIYGYHTVPECSPEVSTVVLVATDNVAVKSVTASTTFPGAIVTRTSQSGNVYTYAVKAPYASPKPDTHIVVTFTARDAAGNHASVTVSIVLEGDQACLG